MPLRIFRFYQDQHGELVLGILQACHCRYIADSLAGKLGKGITDLSSGDLSMISDMLITKYLFDQPLGTVDLFGGLLANTFIAGSSALRQRTHLSDQAQRIKDGALPLPIYTAVRAENISVENMWYEFTPYEVGGSWLNAYVPTWAFGRKFQTEFLLIMRRN